MSDMTGKMVRKVAMSGCIGYIGCIECKGYIGCIVGEYIRLGQGGSPWNIVFSSNQHAQWPLLLQTKYGVLIECVDRVS